MTDIAGFAIWASVSDEVDLKIREQIKTGTFPIRLKPEDWNSGPVNWLLDVIAPDRKSTGQVIANFRQVVKEGDLRIHPQVAGLVDDDMRGKMMGGAAGDGNGLVKSCAGERRTGGQAGIAGQVFRRAMASALRTSPGPIKVGLAKGDS